MWAAPADRSRAPETPVKRSSAARPVRSLILGLLVALAVPLAASAQEPAPDPAYTAAVSTAKQAFAAGDFLRAAASFEEAFSIEAKGNLLYNIAVCYEKAGKVPEAVANYERFIDAVPGTPLRPKIEQRIAALRASIQGKYLSVNVRTEPPGAVIFVDDKARGAMGAAPVSFQLFPGSYTIIAELADYEPAKRRVELVEGQPMDLDIRLIPSSRVGTVNLRISERGAEVSVDGRSVGRAPLEEPLRLMSGPHEITVVKPGFPTWTRTIEVQPRQTQTVQVDLSEGAEDDIGGAPGGGGGFLAGDRLWAVITAGAGVALIGGGVATGLSAQSLHDELATKQDNGEAVAQSDIDLGNTLTLTTNVLYGVGAAALIGGTVWWFMADPGSSVSGSIATVGPTSDGGAAVMLQGSF